MKRATPRTGVIREVGQSVILLALAGSSIGGAVAMLNMATRVLGR